MPEKTRLEKSCGDPKCRERWEKFDPACREAALDFEYCPFCAEELTLSCSACRETVADPVFRFCPWCGREFEK